MEGTWASVLAVQDGSRRARKEEEWSLGGSRELTADLGSPTSQEERPECVLGQKPSGQELRKERRVPSGDGGSSSGGFCCKEPGKGVSAGSHGVNVACCFHLR